MIGTQATGASTTNAPERPRVLNAELFASLTQGLTKGEIAKRLGISHMSLWRLTTGTQPNVSLQAAGRLADRLGVTVDSLFPPA